MSGIRGAVQGTTEGIHGTVELNLSDVGGKADEEKEDEREEEEAAQRMKEK